MEWDCSDYQVLEDINEESDTDIEGAVLSPSTVIATCGAVEKQGTMNTDISNLCP